jgi:hypothetical protein
MARGSALPTVARDLMILSRETMEVVWLRVDVAGDAMVESRETMEVVSRWVDAAGAVTAVAYRGV